LDETLLPRRAPLGWVFIVRPDRCVMAEGPVEEVESLLDQALQRLGVGGPPSKAAMPTAQRWSAADAT
jgi:3-(3-hydroxy-phenyl)propionate hydroxylase